MGPLDILNHLLNLAAPALGVAVTLPVFARWIATGKAGKPDFLVQVAINFAAGLAVLLLGLWVSGRDGRMLVYIALVLVCASTQWAMQRAWRA